jgi:hypothetical protein
VVINGLMSIRPGVHVVAQQGSMLPPGKEQVQASK